MPGSGPATPRGRSGELGEHRLGHLPGTDLAWVGSETPPMSDLPAEVEVGTEEMTEAVLGELA